MPPEPAPPRSSFAIDVPEGLLRRARAGDRAAMELLYRWFERPVYTLALRMLGGAHGDARAEAQDVLQDTMLKVFGSLGDFRGGSPFWGWLRRIAVNEVLMRMRRDRRFEPEVVGEGALEPADEHTPLPPAAADAAALQRALARLPDATRSVLWLYHAEGHTHEEIAALMQRTPSFSKSQLARGTRRLRTLLEQPAASSREVAHA